MGSLREDKGKWGREFRRFGSLGGSVIVDVVVYYFLVVEDKREDN